MYEASFSDFSGGLNSVSTMEKVKKNELAEMSNKEIGKTGTSIFRRYGFKKHIVPTVAGKGQGFWRYYRTDTDYDEILAAGGKFYINGVEKSITGLAGGFQTIKPIEAVQYSKTMFFATGTKFCEYDGTEIKVVSPYKPEPFDALYVGTNALADDPNNFMQDGTAISIRLDGVTFSTRYGYMNEPVTLTAYASYPSGKTMEYQFEWRHVFMEEGKWVLGQDWSTAKTWEFTPNVEADIQFRVNIRESGLTVAEHQYLVPKFVIKTVKTDEYKENENLHGCTKIILHWERIWLYENDFHPKTAFFSHARNPRYFPRNNNFDFENPHNEKATKLVRFRDMLVAFTKNSVQALFGTSPEDFRRVLINSDIGCIAPESVQVVDNVVFFLSNKGVYYLESVGTVEDRANVEPVDERVSNHVSKDPLSCSAYFDEEYHILFPSTKKRLRFYKEMNMAAAKDDSERFTFDRFYTYDNQLFAQDSVNGNIYLFDKTVFDDDGFIYKDSFTTPYYDFGYPYNNKRLKEVELIIASKLGNVNMTGTIFADTKQVTSSNKHDAELDKDGNVVWNIIYDSNIVTDFESWVSGQGTIDFDNVKLRVSGKFYRSKLAVVHENTSPNVIVGLCYRFMIGGA